MMSENAAACYSNPRGVDRVQELEMILDNVRQEYEIELEQAWNEVDRVQLENQSHLERISNLESSKEVLGERCRDLEIELENRNNDAKVETSQGETSPMKPKKIVDCGDDVSEMTEPTTVFFPPKPIAPDIIKNSSCNTIQERRHSMSGASISAVTALSNESKERDHDQRRRSWTDMFKSSTRKLGADTSENGESKELMHQLQVLQDSKQMEISELTMKLLQREAAIATLERTIELREQVVTDLREELDDVKGIMTCATRLQPDEERSFRRSLCTYPPSDPDSTPKRQLKKKKSRRRTTMDL